MVLPSSFGGPARQRHVGRAGDGAEFAIVERLDFRKFINVLEQEIADAPQQLAPLTWRQTPPGTGLEGMAGSSHGPVNVFALAVRHVREDGGIGGIEHREGPARSGFDPFAAIRLRLGFASQAATSGLTAAESGILPLPRSCLGRWGFAPD
jgi:hypothetical protein